MIYGNIHHQRLTLGNEHVVADTIDYLEMKFLFRTDDWDGLEKWAHFMCGDTVYDIPLTDGCIRKEDHLNLSAGTWQIWLHGSGFADGEVIERITTSAAELTVLPCGNLDGEPFPEVPASELERILARLKRLETGGIVGDGGDGSGFGMIYDIGAGLTVSDDLVLSAEVGADSFTEIPDSRVQEIFSNIMTEG